MDNLRFHVDEADPAEDRELLLGNLALKTNVITHAQLREALSIQAKEAVAGRLPRQLGLILLAKGYIREDQLGALLEEQRRRRAGLPST
ncbi:MAG TPA: hypothetical protein VEJ18_22450 [Planctomycetota bacterium]|nr:hypothetical protein [Planctomycetota bacterium]